MRLSYCPRCLRNLNNTAVCPLCGPTSGVRALRPHHLPPGTILGGRVFLGLSRGEDGDFIRYDARRLDTGERTVLWELFPTGALQREPGGLLKVIDSKQMEARLSSPPLPRGWQGEIFSCGGTLYALPTGEPGEKSDREALESVPNASLPSALPAPTVPQCLVPLPAASCQGPEETFFAPADPVPSVLRLPPATTATEEKLSSISSDSSPEAAVRESPLPYALPHEGEKSGEVSPDAATATADEPLHRPPFRRRRGSGARAAVLLLTALFLFGLLLPQTARAAENAAQQVLDRLLHKREPVPEFTDLATPVPAPQLFPEASSDPNSLLLGGFCQTDGETLLYCGGDLRLYAESVGEREVLRLNGTALFPLLTEEGLYFVEYRADGCAIRRLSNGVNYAEELYVSKEELSFLGLRDGKLWFLEGDRLRTTDSDGHTETLARGTSPRDLGLTEAGPVWLDDRGLWRKPEGEEPLLLTDACLSWQFRAGLFYCAVGEEIRVLNLLGETLLSYPIPCEAISVVADRLYYANGDQIGCLNLKDGSSAMILDGLAAPAQRLTAVNWQGSDLLWYLTEEDEGRRVWLAQEDGSGWQPQLLNRAETE